MGTLVRVRAAVLIAVIGALASVPVATAGDGAAADEPRALSLAAPSEPARYNKSITLTGALSPAASGVEIALQRANGAGKALAKAVTGDDGTFRARLRLKQPTTIVARVVETDELSTPVDVAVRPKLAIRVRKAAAFTDANVKLTVDPHAAAGVASVAVKRNGRTVQTVRARVRKGRASVSIVAPGPGRYIVAVKFDPPRGFAAATAKASGEATTRTLKAGATGRDVAGLIRKLRSLNFHVPAASQSFSASLTDSVIAFQKIAGLSRTGVVGQADWLALAKARPVQPTRSGPGNRIEVDKTRQILIKVRGGKVAGVLPVSTGATGNTPEGVHNIRWKAPSTTTWLGPGILYRTLTFFGNAFAIHGWKSVPAHPASAGCVRVPIWTADWLYDRSPVGETVIVHR